MRIAHLFLASFLAVALVACDEEGDKSSDNPGGSGGVPILCGGVHVIEMESATSTVLNDRTDTVDNWDGICAPLVDPAEPGGPRISGNDVVVRFVVPEDGDYRFTTGDSNFDALLYVLEDCDDGFTALACNDGFLGEGPSDVAVFDRKAGEELFVVVDSVGVRQSTEFMLTAEKFDPIPPVIDEAYAYFNSNGKVTGFQVTGTYAERPIVAFSIVFYGPAPSYQAYSSQASTIPLEDMPPQLNFEVSHAGGEFRVEGSLVLGANVGAIDIAIIDDYGLSSEMVHKTVVAPPTVGRGELCDPLLGFNTCEGTDVCPTASQVCTPAG